MQVNALESEVELLKLEEVKGDSIETAKSKMNKELKKTEKVLNEVIELSSALKVRTNEAEQLLIRHELGKEMHKLLAHDLDMKDCDKSNAFQCSGFAKKLMIKKYGEANMTEANKSITVAKDVVENFHSNE